MHDVCKTPQESSPILQAHRPVRYMQDYNKNLSRCVYISCSSMHGTWKILTTWLQQQGSWQDSSRKLATSWV